jgi:hypothetical protein
MERAVVHESVERVMGSLPGNFKLQQSLQQHTPLRRRNNTTGRKPSKSARFTDFAAISASSTV